MIDTNDLYIVNYSHENCTPLENIMRLPREDAFVMANKLSENNAMTTAFYRFADFQNYYPKRLATDQILYNKFVALGGKPRCLHPLSFVLHDSDYLHSWFDKGTVTRIALKQIPAKYISFTYGDSMSTLEKKKPLLMLNKEALLDTVESYKGSLDEYLEEIGREYRYIEVQLWNDEYCQLPDID